MPVQLSPSTLRAGSSSAGSLDEFSARHSGREELGEAARLVQHVVRSCLANAMSADALTEYCDNFATPEALDLRYLAGHQFWTAHAGEESVGVLEVKGPAHILMLFVMPEFQRRGIARILLGSAFPGFPFVRCPLTVNSVPDAVGAYERFGFHAAGGEQNVGGIRFVPMNLDATLA